MLMPLSAVLRVYFENAAGRVLEHPDGYVVFTYRAGPRELRDFQALITHTGHLLVRNNWYRVLGDQRVMTPLSPEESAGLSPSGNSILGSIRITFARPSSWPIMYLPVSWRVSSKASYAPRT